MARIVLITGGARSGKSGYAERCAEAFPGDRLYVATCPAGDGDAELAGRISRHQRDRAGKGWRTVEEPTDLAGVLAREKAEVVLVDCLTLWISNLMFAADGDALDEDGVACRCRDLAEICRARKGVVVFVTNEVGAGVVPDNLLARRFRDLAGRAGQAMAAAADQVALVACGLPLVLKNVNNGGDLA